MLTAGSLNIKFATTTPVNPPTTGGGNKCDGLSTTDRSGKAFQRSDDWVERCRYRMQRHN